LNSLKIPQAEDTKLGTTLPTVDWTKHIQAEITWTWIEQNVPAARQQIATIDRKQIAIVRGNP